MLADALEISFVVLTPISLLLTIMNCIVECRNQVKDEPRTRSRNIDVRSQQQLYEMFNKSLWSVPLWVFVGV